MWMIPLLTDINNEDTLQLSVRPSIQDVALPAGKQVSWLSIIALAMRANKKRYTLAI